MKECDTCLFREHKDELLCCAGNQVGEAFRDLLNTFLESLPFCHGLGAYECQAYEADPRMEVAQ